MVGRYVWQVGTYGRQVRMVGRYIWQVGGTYGRYVWQVCMVGMYGRYVWQVCMVGKQLGMFQLLVAHTLIVLAMFRWFYHRQIVSSPCIRLFTFPTRHPYSIHIEDAFVTLGKDRSNFNHCTQIYASLKLFPYKKFTMQSNYKMLNYPYHVYLGYNM